MNCLSCNENVTPINSTIIWPSETKDGEFYFNGVCSHCAASHKQDYTLDKSMSVTEILQFIRKVADGG